MTLLNRYLLRRNLFLLLTLLGMGCCIYILTDLFQRIDVFLDAGHGFASILIYFGIKLPMIISQILPAIFLLAIVIQLSLMNKNRESVALRAGGISPTAMFKFVVLYGLVWACLQFAFSQVLGVSGERAAADMWQQDIRQRNTSDPELHDLRFLQGRYMVQLDKAWPAREEASGLHIYELTDDGLSIERTFKAETGRSHKKEWVLHNVQIASPGDLTYTEEAECVIPLRQSLAPFMSFKPRANISELDILTLRQNIKNLEAAGTNVESRKTNYYSRFSYAASLVVMGLLALAITIRLENIYLAILFSLVCTFAFYTVAALLSALGEGGTLNPLLAAFLPDLIFAAAAGGYIASQSIKTMRRNL